MAAKKRDNMTKTLKMLRDNGWTCDIVERWVPTPRHPGGGFRRDFLNLFDVIAFRASSIIGVQVTGEHGASTHIKDMLANENLEPWCEASDRQALLINWRKLKIRGTKMVRLEPRVVELSPKHGRIEHRGWEWFPVGNYFPVSAPARVDP